MKRVMALCVVSAMMFGLGVLAVEPGTSQSAKVIKLPEPVQKGTLSLEETLAKRRSVRSFSAEPISMEQIGQLAWAAQGITAPERGLRTAPSAGATYPIELYIVTQNGTYHYVPQGHQVEILKEEDLRGQLARAAGGQASVRNAAADFVITAVYSRTMKRYGERGRTYVHLEAGHVGQNIQLQAVSLGLGSVPIGAFKEEEIRTALSLPADHEPVYMFAVGHPATESR